MNEDCLKLAAYCDERDRAGDRFVADALLDICERHAVQVSALFRGTAGFGAAHHLHTDRVLTLSEDLPIVAVAVDTRERIERLLPEVAGLGHVTLERARLLTGGSERPDVQGRAKLTVYVGRRARIGDQPAFRAVVELLRRCGVDGATVLLGVDGTVHGARRRARFFAANADVPLMIIAVGAGEAVAAAVAELGEVLPEPLMTLERAADGDDAPRRKLMVHGGEPHLHAMLMLRLRASDVRGATALRGIWGYDGERPPHGDRFWSVRRQAPVLTVVVDTPERIGAARAIVDELFGAGALVTSEPSFAPAPPARPRSR